MNRKINFWSASAFVLIALPLAARKYIVMDTPERSNQEPVGKLLKEVIKQ